jgi:hypothetical protein
MNKLKAGENLDILASICVLSLFLSVYFALSHLPCSGGVKETAPKERNSRTSQDRPPSRQQSLAYPKQVAPSSDDSNNNFFIPPPKTRTEITIHQNTCDQDCLTIILTSLPCPQFFFLCKPKAMLYPKDG